MKLAVAALSARALAQAAGAAGCRVAALDAFGDADTRAAAPLGWFDVARPANAGIALDAARVDAALERAAQLGCEGWIAGSGFEAWPTVLARGAARLPLLGTPPAEQARLREPRCFLALLDALDLPHPETRFDAPADTQGWLRKADASSGGLGVFAAEALAPGSPSPNVSHHWQRRVAGEPMSATVVFDGPASRVLGFNRQLVAPQPGRPFVFAGVLGPVPVPPAVRQTLERAVAALAQACALRGLASLDFVCDGERAWLLELNPRPSASAALYDEALTAHLRACGVGLPAARRRTPASSSHEPTVRGWQIVHAAQPCALDAAALQALAERPAVHDVPHAPLALPAGAPIASVSATGMHAAQVQARLDAAAARVRALPMPDTTTPASEECCT